MEKMKMEKIINFEPAYDKRNSDPNKNFGVHGVNIRFVLKGDKGAVQFLLYTSWHLPHVTKELKVKGYEFDPLPADLGYHSLVPIYEGQHIMSKSCIYLDGKPCYYDGSRLATDKIYNVLLEEGDEGIWRELEKYYKDIFGENEK